MKIQQQLVLAFAGFLILLNSFPISLVKINNLSTEFSGTITEEKITNSEEVLTEDEHIGSADIVTEDKNISSADIITEDEITKPADIAAEDEHISSADIITEDEITKPADIAAEDEHISSAEIIAEDKNIKPADIITENKDINLTDISDLPVLDEKPMFHAKIEFSPSGYRIKGTFTEFPPDISLIQTLYSLDGETYQVCEDSDWDLDFLGTEDPTELNLLQNHICLYSTDEPLYSYLEEKLDYFYLKLRLTKENGVTYESQPAVIQRNPQQPIPEGSTVSADFSSSMKVYEKKPYRSYGKYQLTINENATPEEVSAFLPDTIPITIMISSEDVLSYAIGTIDCPVKWKPLTFSRLTAGESITIADAAEAIIVPSGTLVTTPMGIFQLTEPLSVEHERVTDEIRLVLNVIAKDDNPAGALSSGRDGLLMAFHLKPTGATAIRAYTLSDGASEWTEIPDFSFQQAINAQLSTANSGYTVVLNNSSEPYRSYQEAKTAGKEPTPFLVGLTIEGGVYHGKQLILPFPGTYQCPPSIPKIVGSGGNEDNAGADNKDDSTEEGQRPNLPQDPEDKPEDTQPDIPTDSNQKQPDDSQKPDNKQPDPPQNTDQRPEDTQPDPPQDTDQRPEDTQPDPPQDADQRPEDTQPDPPQDADQRPENTQQTPSRNMFVQEDQTDLLLLNIPDPSSQFIIPQIRNDDNAKNENQTAFSYGKAVTDVQARITIPEILPQKDSESSALISPDTKENADHRTKDKKWKPFLLLTTVIAGFSIAGICIAATVKKRS